MISIHLAKRTLKTHFYKDSTDDQVDIHQKFPGYLHRQCNGLRGWL